MSEFKGTKGNAKVFNECFKNEYDFYVQPISISSSDNILFANAYAKTLEECVFNAKLISCAPEMLEMLNKVDLLQSQNYGNGMNTHIELIWLSKEIRELIKKATCR